VICIKLHDGSTQLAVVLGRNGSTLTVKAYDGFLYEISDGSQDSRGVYQVS
jgi:hypothetical protein